MLPSAGLFPPGECESVEHGNETCEAEAGESGGLEEQKNSCGALVRSFVGASRSRVSGWMDGWMDGWIDG